MRSLVALALLLPTFLAAETKPARIEFVIGQRDLIPEGIDYDPGQRAFFVSSVYRAKIVRVGEGGEATDFIGEREHGFQGGVGVRVDGARGLLWAASAMGYQTRGFQKEEDGQSGLFAFELADGSLARKLMLDDGEKHLLNDLVVAADGTVYVTDTLTGTIYRTDGTRELEAWLRSDAIAYPNGICIGENKTALYVAHDGGVSAALLETKKIEPVRTPDGVRLDGIDGLYCLDGALLAVQNHRGLERVARFPLTSRSEVSGEEVLLEDHPSLHIPTTLAVVGDEAFLIANSFLDAFDKDGSLRAPSELEDPIVLRLPLAVSSGEP